MNSSATEVEAKCLSGSSSHINRIYSLRILANRLDTLYPNLLQHHTHLFLDSSAILLRYNAYRK